MKDMTKKIAFFVSLCILAGVAFSQESIGKDLSVTNLSDKLHTRVEYDKSTGIDIRRLNLDSIHADKHKARNTTVKSLAVDIRTPK